ncbi:MAG: T9SS type A sorting domain-containing protein [Bacteroidales bacterium]|nr:T9SS type A sorting domain-containing protein [Bacteroidales bacterium]
MKKLLLTLIVSLAFCGSIFAQTSHWAEEFDPETNNPYEMQGFLSAFIQIDDNFVTGDDNWEALEVAAFDESDNIRGVQFLSNHMEEYGDPYPVVEICIFYNLSNDSGKPIHFVMYNHETGTTYTDCSILYLNEGGELTSYEIVTGEDYFDQWDLVDYGPVLNFTSPATTGITKEIEAYTEEGGYYLIASPVGTITADVVENLLSNTYDLYAFDQTEDLEWRNYKNENFDLEVGKGYLYANSGTDDGQSVTLTFPGEAYNGEGEVPLVLDNNAELAGWNLIGNPFNQNATLADGRDFYVMNGDGSEIIAAEESVIAPMEGIFVIATEEGESVTFVPDETKGRSANIALNLSNGRNVIDRAIVRFGQDKQLPKFQMKENSTKVYIQQNGRDYAVVSSEAQGEMPVSFKASKNGTYNISFNSDVEFSYLHLIDNLTGNDVNLLDNPSYSFDANISDYANRFRLVFSTGTASDDNFAFYNDGNIIVNSNGSAILNVIDVLGRTISSQNINGTQNVSVNATSGVYTIQLIQGENVKTQKIVVE